MDQEENRRIADEGGIFPCVETRVNCAQVAREWCVGDGLSDAAREVIERLPQTKKP